MVRLGGLGSSLLFKTLVREFLLKTIDLLVFLLGICKFYVSAWDFCWIYECMSSQNWGSLLESFLSTVKPSFLKSSTVLNLELAILFSIVEGFNFLEVCSWSLRKCELLFPLMASVAVLLSKSVCACGSGWILSSLTVIDWAVLAKLLPTYLSTNESKSNYDNTCWP